MDDLRETRSLRNAAEEWRTQPGAPSNSNDWYRKSAHRYGWASFGSLRIEALKVGRSWFVYTDDFDKALSNLKQRQAAVRAATEAYQERRLLGKPGQSTDTNWGGYLVTEHFHLPWDKRGWQYGGGTGSWMCSTCWTPAKTERNNDECHRCRDWSPCGNDCQLSRVFCEVCGTSK